MIDVIGEVIASKLAEKEQEWSMKRMPDTFMAGFHAAQAVIDKHLGQEFWSESEIEKEGRKEK